LNKFIFWKKAIAADVVLIVEKEVAETATACKYSATVISSA
jgi:hypothetical protein